MSQEGVRSDGKILEQKVYTQPQLAASNPEEQNVPNIIKPPAEPQPDKEPQLNGVKSWVNKD